MDLIRDILDVLLIDRHGRTIGRADALVVELRDDAARRRQLLGA